MRIPRRDFLRRSARFAGTGALVAIGAPGRGAPRAAENVRCAFIGVGGRAQGLLGWAMEHPQATVAALCDVDEQNLGRTAKRVKDTAGAAVETAKDFRRVLDRDDVDCVFVATPHHWHAPIAVRALDAGKHVYCEKPASHVLAEGRLLVEAARRSDRLFQHGTQMRSSEVTAAAAEVLASGILGEIKMAKAWGVEPRGDHPDAVPDEPAPRSLDWNTWLGPAPERPFNTQRHRRWNAFREYGNGEIGGDGIHDLDMARWGLGVTTHPVRVTAHGSRIHVRGQSDYPDNMLVTYQYAADKVLVYENRNFAPYAMHGWDNGNVFYGTRGYMVFSRRGYFQTYLGADEAKGPGMRGGAGNEENVHGFLDCVRGAKPTNADAETSHLSCALVHLGEIAYRTGRVIHFDPVRETILGDEEAAALLTKDYRSPWSFERA